MVCLLSFDQIIVGRQPKLETVTYRQLREMDKVKGAHRPNDGDFEMALLAAIEQLKDLKVDTRYALSLNRSLYPENIRYLFIVFLIFWYKKI